MREECFVYIVTNQRNTTLYTGITSDLIYRVHQHKTKTYKGFSQRYNLDKLVYYEIHDDPNSAIKREKQIKAGSRKKKIELINNINPEWRDLYEDLINPDGIATPPRYARMARNDTIKK